jgi:molybdopterin-guanine dinucleotide biosynthesis protein B
MKAVGITGWSGAGKTTLLVRLLPVLAGQGLRVSTVKHAHHGVDLDHPGKDSHRHREAGAVEVLVAAPDRWALQHENRDGAEPSLGTLLARMAPVDLVLVEGFKREPIPRLEVWRAQLGRPPMALGDPGILAVAGDGPVEGVTVPILPLDAIAAIAGFILTRCDPGPAGKNPVGKNPCLAAVPGVK